MISMDKIIKHSCLSLLTLILLYASVFAQNLEKTGSSGAQFLKIGIGARAMALGGSYVSIADDITSLYWNPAGIVRIENNAGFVGHNKWIGDSEFESIGFAHSFNQQSAIGVSINYLSFGEMEQTTVRQPDGNGKFFGAYDLAASLTYARMLVQNFSVGFSIKYIKEQIWDLSASTVAFDLGALFSPGFKPITLGVSLSNFSPDLEFKGENLYDEVGFVEGSDPVEITLRTTPYPLPLIFRFGAAYTFFNGEQRKFILSVEGNHLTDSEQKVNMGAEYYLSDAITLRSGYRFNDDEGEYSAGFGLRYPATESTTAQIDYAYSDLGRLLNSHRFTFTFEF